MSIVSKRATNWQNASIPDVNRKQITAKERFIGKGKSCVLDVGEQGRGTGVPSSLTSFNRKGGEGRGHMAYPERSRECTDFLQTNIPALHCYILKCALRYLSYHSNILHVHNANDDPICI